MNVLVIGSGGREHALAFKAAQNTKVNTVFVAPGNAGTALEPKLENVAINVEDLDGLLNFAQQNNVELTIVGPEVPLVLGVVDKFREHNMAIFGPTAGAAQLEGSKSFTKDFLARHNIPTGDYQTFEQIDPALAYLKEKGAPIVIKADGLAAGKGVYISENYSEASKAVDEIFDGKFGNAENLLIEEFLNGEEMSFFIISDGQSYKMFGTAQDHKRVFEGDQGKNTGGMGAYSPSRLESHTLNQKIINKIIEPTLKGLKNLNCEYKGFLYAGLMIVNGEPFLIEYNVRMGDPECQTLLPKLKTDFSIIINKCIEQKLYDLDIEWHDDKSICIVLCSKGYPETYKNNVELNLGKLNLKKKSIYFSCGYKNS